MGALMKKAIAELNKLPERNQNALAKLILDELQWDRTLYKTSNTLLQLANEASKEYYRGKTKPLSSE